MEDYESPDEDEPVTEAEQMRAQEELEAKLNTFGMTLENEAPQGVLIVKAQPQREFLTFYRDGKQVGSLNYENGAWSFVGNTDASVHAFIQGLAPFLDKYIENYLAAHAE